MRTRRRTRRAQVVEAHVVVIGALLSALTRLILRRCRFTHTDGISQERHTKTHPCTQMHTRTCTQLPTYAHTHMSTHKSRSGPRRGVWPPLPRGLGGGDAGARPRRRRCGVGRDKIHTRTVAHAHSNTHTHTKPDHTRLPTHTHTHMSTRKNMRAYAHIQPLIQTGIHTNICTWSESARTHTLQRTHTHHAYGYAMGATAVPTLLSSYAHTILLLC